MEIVTSLPGVVGPCIMVIPVLPNELPVNIFVVLSLVMAFRGSNLLASAPAR